MFSTLSKCLELLYKGEKSLQKRSTHTNTPQHFALLKKTRWRRRGKTHLDYCYNNKKERRRNRISHRGIILHENPDAIGCHHVTGKKIHEKMHQLEHHHFPWSSSSSSKHNKDFFERERKVQVEKSLWMWWWRKELRKKYSDALFFWWWWCGEMCGAHI